MTETDLKKLQEIADQMTAAAEKMEQAVNQPLSWSEDETAIMLDMKTLTLQRRRNRGEISFSRVGRDARYTRAHLEEFLINQTVPAGRRNGAQRKNAPKKKSQEVIAS